MHRDRHLALTHDKPIISRLCSDPGDFAVCTTALNNDYIASAGDIRGQLPRLFFANVDKIAVHYLADLIGHANYRNARFRVVICCQVRPERPADNFSVSPDSILQWDQRPDTTHPRPPYSGLSLRPSPSSPVGRCRL